MKFIQMRGHTDICVSGEVNAAEYESYRFCDTMTKHSITVHHWFGYAYYYHKHFSFKLRLGLYHPNVYSDMTITLDGNTVSFHCCGWKRQKTFENHSQAVEYANQLLDEDMTGKNYRVMPPSRYKRSMRGIHHFDSHDNWDSFGAFYYPYDIDWESTYFPKRRAKAVVLEKSPYMREPHMKWAAYIKYSTYIVEFIPKADGNDVVFDIAKTRIIGNCAIRPEQWEEFWHTVVQTFIDEVRWKGYICEYDETTNELKILGLART